MNGKSSIVIAVVLLLIIGLGYILYNKYNESFRADFPLRESLATNRKWNNAKVVIFQNVYTGMALTNIRSMNVPRLEPLNILNPNQYWIYSSSGAIMQPSTGMCLSFSNPSGSTSGNSGLNASPSINICSNYGGEMFIYDPKTKRIINVTGMPYYTVGRKRLLSKIKRKCLSYYPVVGGPNREISRTGMNLKNLKNSKDLTQSMGLGFQSVAVIECDADYNNEYMQWNIIPMSMPALKNARNNAQNYGTESYAKITASNNDRNLYPLNSPSSFNAEKWKSDKIVRPYYDGQKTYSNMPGSFKYMKS